MRTATDKAEQKALDDVTEYGLHIIHVAEDEIGPCFTYSIGLFENYLHPEVIIIGLKQEVAHATLNNLAYDIKRGKTYTAGEFHEGAVDNFLCYFGDVPKSNYREYVGWARWFYGGDEIPLIQCVYPTVTGVFPWNKNFPEEARWFCQLLTEAPKEH